MLLSIGAGGALGAVSRFLLSHLIAERLALSSSLATLSVNILGCFCMGLCAGYLTSVLPDSLRAFLTIGFLGAFTTFSSFALDSHHLFQADKFFATFTYIIFSVVFSLLAFTIGFMLTELRLS